ncbi:hypothetical protein RJ640_008698 [Escallonia rubra]|uniref:Helicase ATP-binding domain-containing protein n=1 Tax=Escallonia rubra TaxID=112253 RepID=A0AA88RDK9_9ASTE|nr:hypothetical protein RJ640_008698 [Escallonia rubra]
MMPSTTPSPPVYDAIIASLRSSKSSSRHRRIGLLVVIPDSKSGRPESSKRKVHVATPGRLVDHLSNTKGFTLRTLKFLVLDEADRLLNEDFEKTIDQVLSVIPRDSKTYLFSATMTKKKIEETGGKKRRKEGDDDEEEVHKYLDRKNGKSFKKSRKR